MNLTVPEFIHKNINWFNFRKALFQVIMPILLTFLTFYNFVSNTTTSTKYVYEYLYFYTWLILFLYGAMNCILAYIFNIYSDQVLFKKEIKIDKNASELMLFENINSSFDNHFIIVTKRIFKLRCSKSIFFTYITKICWIFGLDCPILIPLKIISKLGNSRQTLTEENEDIILHTTLTNLYKYHPTKYNVIPIMDFYDEPNHNYSPKTIITKLDKSICDIQESLYNISIHSTNTDIDSDTDINIDSDNMPTEEI